MLTKEQIAAYEEDGVFFMPGALGRSTFRNKACPK